MSKIVVGVAEVNAKNNANLAEIAAADLERVAVPEDDFAVSLAAIRAVAQASP